MKILLITDEVWNDKLYTNGILTNWFSDFPGEFANIYLSSESPYNNCCKKYFQITDKMMLLSLFTGRKAGISFCLEEDIREEENLKTSLNFQNNFLKIMEKKLPVQFKTNFSPRFPVVESLRLIKDYIWLLGKYDEEGLAAFINEFRPDIIFSLRYASRKVLRLERLVAAISSAPLLAFSGDDEYTLKQLRFSPLYWYRRIALRRDLKRNMAIYEKYYTHSAAQARLYEKKFHIKTSILLKCGIFPEVFTEKKVNEPIRLVYAGRLYCKRWKTLVLIKEALLKLNKEKVRMILEIYTKDRITATQRKKLEDGRNCIIKPPVSGEELKEIYQKADIALHVEAFDLKNRLLTKYSFSTKIIDCLASSCAVLSICPKEHPAYEYLKKHKGAICLSLPSFIYPALKKILFHKDILLSYQKKAWALGIKNHRKEKIQEFLYQDMKNLSLKDFNISEKSFQKQSR